MSEETKTTDANISAESTPVESAETSSVPEATEETPREAPEAVESSEEVESSPSREEERKPSRAERRIQELVAKTKQQEEILEKLQKPQNDWKSQVREPLISPNEYQEGVDPNILEQRIEQRVAQSVQQQLAQREQLNAYKGQIEAHTRDLERVLEDYPELTEDPALEEAFLEAYQDANYVNGGFVPRKTPSQIAASLRKVRDSVATRSTADISGKMAKHVAEQAVTPRASEVEEVDYERQESYRKARTSRGNTDAWADYLKKTGLAKL